MQDNTERLQKTLSSSNKSHSEDIRAVVDHHAYYITKKKTGMDGAITGTSTTLVERKTRVEGKTHRSAELGIYQEIN